MKKLTNPFYHICFMLMVLFTLNSCTNKEQDDLNSFDPKYDKGDYYMELSINDGPKDRTEYYPYWASAWGHNARTGLVGKFGNTNNKEYDFGLTLVVVESEAEFLKYIKQGTSIKLFAAQNMNTPGFDEYMDNVKGLGIMSSLDYGEIYSDLSVASNGTATITSVKKVTGGYKVKGNFEVKYRNNTTSSYIKFKGKFSLPVLIY